MTHAESQIVARIAFLAWEHKEEELRAETGKLWVAAAITTTETERYKQERADRERYWQTKLIASEVERDDLRQRCGQLRAVLKATSEAERHAKLALIGYRSAVAESRKSKAEIDALAAERDAIAGALEITGGNNMAAARLLGLNPDTLVNRMRSGETPEMLPLPRLCPATEEVA
jgi:transcriptional regulator with GAF, ATPase, and Fis domain